MRRWIPALGALCGFLQATPAQPFAFTHRMIPVDSDSTVAVAHGDVDGDGDLDALIGNELSSFTSGVRLYLNGGTGRFTDVTPSNLPVPLAQTLAVAFGDVDGDGDLDAFLGINGQSRLCLNGGTGVFTDVTATNLPALSEPTFAVALGDVDGDGDLDAFVGNLGQNRLYLNGGTGVFADVTATNLPALGDNTVTVALGDVDGDGDLDAFVGNSPFVAGPGDRLLLNAGGGVFSDASATNLPSPGFGLVQTRAAALGDVDGDGDLDAFVGRSGETRLYLNGGTGVFADGTATNLPAPNFGAAAVALGDVDGDGDLDAFLGGGNLLYLNGGTGIFTDVTATNLPALLDLTRAIALGDVDGDGDLDAHVGNQEQDRLHLNDGTGVFIDVTATDPLPDLAEETRAVALGDVDGDGDLDALTGNYGVNRLFLNAGEGTFADVTATGFAGPLTDTNAAAFGDVDGDGDLDAYLGITGSNRLFRNLGAGTFLDVTAASLPVLSAVTWDVALGDVDGDGDLDAFAGIASFLGAGGQDRLFLNGGTGTFTDVTATNLPAPLDETRAVALGDVDGDGDLDAFTGNLNLPLTSGAQNRLYLNGGTGVFTDVTATNLPAQVEFTQAVALGDVDGDGDLDAFTGSQPQDRLYLNSGTGVLADVTATNLPVGLGLTVAVALGDMDGDGDLDAFLGNDAGQNRLLDNGGSGTFTDVTSTELPARIDHTHAVALGDVDGDGDLDAVVPFALTSTQIRTYTNLARQLTWLGNPRTGKPLVLEVRGPGGGTWLLAASPGTGNLPLPPFGTLRLALPTLFIVAGGVLDAQGRADLTLPVPANPALIGLSLYWQALVGPPFRLTNLEITTVTGL